MKNQVKGKLDQNSPLNKLFVKEIPSVNSKEKPNAIKYVSKTLTHKNPNNGQWRCLHECYTVIQKEKLRKKTTSVYI